MRKLPLREWFCACFASHDAVSTVRSAPRSSTLRGATRIVNRAKQGNSKGQARRNCSLLNGSSRGASAFERARIEAVAEAEDTQAHRRNSCSR